MMIHFMSIVSKICNIPTCTVHVNSQSLKMATSSKDISDILFGGIFIHLAGFESLGDLIIKKRLVHFQIYLTT